MNQVWTSHSQHPCPSCAALHGQVHTSEQWQAFGVKPADHELYCKEHCSCTLTETDEHEHGDLSAVPLRGPALSAGSSLPLMEKNMKDITLSLKATPTDTGFDILAINAGEAKGHGITFSDTVLQEAIGLYDKKPVFIDHAGMLSNGPSVRDLAGTITMPMWNSEHRGIQAKLTPAGPAADVLLSVRDAAKTDAAIMEAIGFSTVLSVKLDKAGNVTKVVRVRSVDVVVDPARGGRFLSAYSQNGHMKGDKPMSDHTTQQADLTEQQAAALELQGVNETVADLKAKQEQALDLQLAQCQILLDSALSASKLPEAAQSAVRKPFTKMLANKTTFLPTDLQEAIKEKREEIAALSSNIQGPARSQVFGMFSSVDQFSAALSDLLGAPRNAGLENLRVRPLRGIQEAYLMATGDVNFQGGYHQEFALVSANFPGLVADDLNKILIQAWKDYEQVYGWWQKIATVEHFSNLNDAKWIRTGTIASLPSVSERGEYAELPIGDNKETSAFYKYGGYVPITLEAMLKDDVRGLQRMPRELALAGIRNISEQVAAIFTTASGAGPTLADTGALFNSTAVTTAGGHANLLTTALGTDYTAWNAVAKAVFNQPMLVKNASGYYGTGKKQAIDPSFVLVPRDLKNQAEALFVPRWEAQAQNVATVSPSWGGRVEVLTVPEWTDATDWAAAVDPKYVPCIMIGEIFGLKPQIFSASSDIDPAMFSNDESRIKVRQFLTVGVADFRGLHKSNV